VRLGADERVFGEPHVQRVKMGARTMSGFARVDSEGYATDAALKKWVARGLAAVASLPAGKGTQAGIAQGAEASRKEIEKA
jgi:hypothetical protein